MAVDDAPPTGGLDAPEPEDNVAVVELEGATVLAEPEGVVAVIDPPVVTDAVLLAGAVEPEPAVTPPGAAIPAEPNGSYIGASSPLSTTLAQPVGSGQAPPLSIVLMVTPVALHPVTVE